MPKVFILIFIFFSLAIQSSYGQTTSLKNLYALKKTKTRSISPENFSGEKGKGGMATVEEGIEGRAARYLGQGWKVNPFIEIQPGETFTLGEVHEAGVINHIWLTPKGDYRLMILRMYWDDETEPSVEVPLGDFFASGWGLSNEPVINSLAICVNPKSGMNSYWQMPFRKKCKITIENMADKKATVYYQIDYSLEEVAAETPYFHAQFRRVNPLPVAEVFTIVDNIKGNGQYVGMYLAHGSRKEGWWGEGEVKFFIDGDKEFPTICTTGEEDYFNGSYSYKKKKEDGKWRATNFSNLYSGYHEVFDSSFDDGYVGVFGQYRWHIEDPVRFEKDLAITVQSLGWAKTGGAYQPLVDDLAATTYWYQMEPHHPFPKLPTKEELVIKKKPIE
ncbi:MAG: glycoside hydrolase family 172 protein [Pirellulales bacterium]